MIILSQSNWNVMSLFSIAATVSYSWWWRWLWVPYNFAQSYDDHLSAHTHTHFISGYNAEMKINSKEIETALKFMPVVKINKEFNENVHRLDLRETESHRVVVPYICKFSMVALKSRAHCTAFEIRTRLGRIFFYSTRFLFYLLSFLFSSNSWTRIQIAWDTKLWTNQKPS